jgi:glycerophosphoryl diester phosphodiesterase
MQPLSTILCFAALSVAARYPAAAAAEVAPPAIVAHRGLLRDAPENTLANFTVCLNLRIGFEFDVRRARDGALICLHDATLDRTTDGRGPCSDFTLAELQRLDAGGWFSSAYRGERIPTVDALFQLIAAHQVVGLYAVDLKADDIELERDVVRLAVRHGILDRLLFIGRAIDQPDVRRRLRAADAHCRVAALANNRAELAKAIAEPDADWVYLRFVPTPADIAAVRAAGKKSFLAGKTVAGLEQANWSDGTRAGIDGILTDHALDCRRHVAATSKEPVKP